MLPQKRRISQNLGNKRAENIVLKLLDKLENNDQERAIEYIRKKFKIANDRNTKRFYEALSYELFWLAIHAFDKIPDGKKNNFIYGEISHIKKIIEENKTEVVT